MKPFLGAYDRVYIPDVEDHSRLRGIVSFSVAKHSDVVWMATDSGVPTEYFVLDEKSHGFLVDVLNQHYRARLLFGKVNAHDLRGVRQYRLLPGKDVFRFAHQWLSFNTSNIKDDNPWDVETSVYDKQRHQVELDVLRRLEWTTMAELGGCVGTFSTRLVEAFPERSISIYEPNEHFVGILSNRLGDHVTVIRGGVDEICDSYDLVFASAVLYYFRRFPYRLLRFVRKYLVTSHIRSYHEEVIQPVLATAGWRVAFEAEMLPEIEVSCSIPMLKEDATIIAWEHPDTSALS
ncbi:hypothetical protein ACFL9U_07065 [Thermodesulfobacteriota bacterium]